MIGGHESERRRDDLVVVRPSVLALEHLTREMQPYRVGGDKMSVGVARVLSPSLFERHGLESKAGPAFLKALADLCEALVDAKLRHEQLNRHRLLLGGLQTHQPSPRFAAVNSRGGLPTLKVCLSAMQSPHRHLSPLGVSANSPLRPPIFFTAALTCRLSDMHQPDRTTAYGDTATCSRSMADH